jgi:hypothetical protein
MQPLYYIYIGICSNFSPVKIQKQWQKQQYPLQN